MPQTIAEKKEQMIKFLLESIVGENITRDQEDILFTVPSRRKCVSSVNYLIKLITKQSDFPYEFTKSSGKRDEDRRRLKKIKTSLLDLTRDMNRAGFIPGFVLLRAETDYSQVRARTELKRLGINLNELRQNIVKDHLKEYYKCFANYGHFLKQKLPSSVDILPHNDLKVIDPLELMLSFLYRFNSVNSERTRERYQMQGQIYHPGLLYFNTKEDRLEEVIFHDVDDATRFRNLECPSCHQKDADHTDCKKEKVYRNEVLARNRARYEKHMWATRVIDSDIRFVQADLDHSAFGITDDLTVAVLEYKPRKK
jgi:hypothetical protein